MRQAEERAKKELDERNKEFLIKEMERRRNQFLQEMEDPRFRNVEEPIYAVLPDKRTKNDFQMYADEFDSSVTSVAQEIDKLPR